MTPYDAPGGLSTAPGPCPVPRGGTANRVHWHFLPPMLRREVERRCGSPVVEATSCDGGFTPGMASVLTCADGSRHFVKAAALRAQRPFAEAYREEIRKLSALPAGVPAPRLLWSIDDGDWVVLATEHVAGVAPARPWRGAELDAVLAALEQVAAVATPAPGALALTPLEEDLADLASLWVPLRSAPPALAGFAEHADEAAALAASCLEVARGDTLVHVDVRDDNVLLLADGTALLCDWNWPVRGAAWVDTVAALIGPRGDGTDVEAALARSPLTRDVPADHVDALLALLVGHFAQAATRPVPPTSPWIRPFQAWQRDVCWHWLGERRGWSADPA